MTADPATFAHDYVYVDTEESLERMSRRLRDTDVIAVDTEADGMHAYFEKVCLVQISSDRDDAFIVDPLALGGLAALDDVFARSAPVKVFHGADFDVVGMKRDFDFEFGTLFDTMVASTLLGDEKVSLRDLVERFFGVTLDKAYTRCDWARRPLSREQLAYSYLDVAYLVRLMEIQQDRLDQADLLEEAQIEFDRLCLREPGNREFDPTGFWRIKGVKDLDPPQQAALAELFKVRERHAEKLDRPVFKVIGNETLLRLAAAAPRSGNELRRVKGVSSYVAGRMGRDIVAAIQRGLEKGIPPQRPRPAPDPSRRLGIAGQKRLGQIRDWRNEASKKHELTTMAILPNYAMFEVARLRPRTIDELAAVDGVGPKRADRWGKALLGLVS